ncbi:replicative helicase loader/inhibitor [Lentibacillus sp. Marseille-P4043]|uniref:replicative helicase loader/inhibitor n=1 Tax=Lentibacillus sp. Marseille-P4043 TaxID=2040293 RepID=UPI000D0B5BB0|nr:replicative helicase loader/inhibitor [Lentibacillus sp. Marseille-P4043]
MNREKVYEVLKLLSEAYPTFDFDQGKINTWTRLLKDQNPAVIMKNAEQYAIENKFAPSLSDLRENKREAYTNDFLKKLDQWEREAIGHKP